ncbi:MAG: SAM-dependent methyltransferase [Streptosporangiaceae bacterium]
MTDQPDWVTPEVDTRRANVARVYDYLLGGSHNFLADQDLGRSMAAVEPNVRVFARANRAFLGQVVRFLCDAGVSQFLDIGSGIPTQGNVHEVAQRASPAARVAYADIDPVAVAHSKAILAGNDNATAVRGDLREPEAILSEPAIRQLIDFTQPVGLLLVSVLPFVADSDDPWRQVATLRDALAPGSYVALCHGTADGNPARMHALGKVYTSSVTAPVDGRSRADILRFFDGFELVEPGLVYISQWRPGGPAAELTADSHVWGLVGVGRKPA